MKFALRQLLVVLAGIVMAGLIVAQRGRDQFSHATADHKKLECSSCHKNPTPNWATARGFPDVADFPGHASCVQCHRRDFFRTSFCAGCHTNPGPRGAARFPFPVRARSHEFSTVFPHSVHQDIIAANDKRRGVAVAHFVKASFTSRVDDPPQFNNCAVCHETSTAVPKTADRLPATQPLAPAAAETFIAKAQFFKTMPSGHSTCFACHYQNVKPAGTDCAGCHSLTTPYNTSAVVKRYSLKFDHQQKEHSVRDCMTCHVRIAANADLKSMKDADVPFMACVSCHNDKLAEETGKRTASNTFQCTYCHTTGVGRFPIPASHK